MKSPKVQSQGDGRRIALGVIRSIRDAGTIACSADPEDRKHGPQFGELLAALEQLSGDGIYSGDPSGAPQAGEQWSRRYSRSARVGGDSCDGKDRHPPPKGRTPPESSGLASRSPAVTAPK